MENFRFKGNKLLWNNYSLDILAKKNKTPCYLQSYNQLKTNVGYFKKTFNRINAFEPLQEISYRLAYFQNEFLTVHNCALSNKKGELQIYIPNISGQAIASLASLEKRDGDCEIRTVEVDTIDNYDFDDVDLIKIDVEGHEESVIEGARKVIQKNLPILIVEIEQRHIKKQIEEVFQCILNLKYSGFFLQNGNLIPLNKSILYYLL